MRCEDWNRVKEVSVYVDEDWQNKGIGTALLSHLCSESEKNGYCYANFQ